MYLQLSSAVHILPCICAVALNSSSLPCLHSLPYITLHSHPFPATFPLGSLLPHPREKPSPGEKLAMSKDSLSSMLWKENGPNSSPLTHSYGQVPPCILFLVCVSPMHIYFRARFLFFSPPPLLCIALTDSFFFPPEWCCQPRHNRELHPALQFAAVSFLTFPLNSMDRAIMFFSWLLSEGCRTSDRD